MKASFLGQDVDVRVSIIPTSHGESVVLRILNKQVGLRDVRSIGFSPDDEQRFLDLIHRSNGMLLVTGPTGSGKTTTLYAALQEVHDDTVNVVTVEDPVEYELAGMTQIQLLDQIGFGFPQTLRHIVRPAPLWISSTMSRMPYRSHTSRRRGKKPGVGTICLLYTSPSPRD